MAWAKGMERASGTKPSTDDRKAFHASVKAEMENVKGSELTAYDYRRLLKIGAARETGNYGSACAKISTVCADVNFKLRNDDARGVVPSSRRSSSKTAVTKQIAAKQQGAESVVSDGREACVATGKSKLALRTCVKSQAGTSYSIMSSPVRIEHAIRNAKYSDIQERMSRCRAGGSTLATCKTSGKS